MNECIFRPAKLNNKWRLLEMLQNMSIFQVYPLKKAFMLMILVASTPPPLN